jgi:predicted transcriptional regulator
MTAITIELPDEIAPEQARRASEIMVEAIGKLQSEGFLRGQIASLLELLGAQIGDLDEGEDPLARLRVTALDTALGALADRNPGETTVSVQLVGGDDGGGRSEIIAALEKHPAFRPFERTHKRLEALDPFSIPYGDLLEQVPPALQQLSEVLCAARSICEEAGCTMIEDRDEWRLQASDEELDNEDSYVFLSDLHPLHAYALERMAERLVGFIGAAHDEQAIDALEEIFGGLDLPPSFRFEEKFAEARAHAALYPTARELILSVGRSGQLWVSQLADALQLPRLILDTWIEEAVEEGLVHRIKKGNRWAVIPAV